MIKIAARQSSFRARTFNGIRSLVGGSFRALGISFLFRIAHIAPIAALTALLAMTSVDCSPQYDPNHGSGWLNSHGTLLTNKEFSTGYCASCHGSDFKGGKSEVSCYSCHDYPHQNNIKENHPDGIKASVDKHGLGPNACISCHEKSAGEKPSCSSCHSEGGPYGYLNHNNKGKLQAEHSKLANKRCQTCHAEKASNTQPYYLDKQGNKYSPTLCVSCHPSSHDQATWTKSNYNLGGNHAIAAGIEGKTECVKCHSPSGILKKSCGTGTNCHPKGQEYGSVDPHKEKAATWKSGHKAYLSLSKDNLTKCTFCHDTTDSTNTGNTTQKDGTKVPTCFSCHNGPSGNPHATGWDKTHSTTTEVKKGSKTCVLCHTASGTPAPTCGSGTNCHSSGGRYGTTPHQQLNWNLGSVHGIYTRNNGYTKCAKCHNTTDSTNTTYTYFLDGTAVNSCFQCHNGPSNPHKSDWDKKHSAAAEIKKGPKKCLTCHAVGGVTKTCGSGAVCHSSGEQYGTTPHKQLNWKLKTAHGAYAKTNGYTKCALCHNTTDPANTTFTAFDDGTKVDSCFQCHNGPSGSPHPTNWKAYLITDITTHAGYLLTNYYTSSTWVMNLGTTGANCESCHYDSINKWSFCVKCHSYPHTGKPFIHKSDASQSSCKKSCHGTDLKGGDSKISCYLCHSDAVLKKMKP